MAKAKARVESLTKETRYDYYAAVFLNPHGQKVLEDLNRVFMDPPSYQPGFTTEEMAWHEGKKAVIRWIKARLADAVTPRQAEAITTSPEEK